MQIFILSVFSIFYVFLISIVLIVDFNINIDKFSAVKLASYFAVIEALVMFWFAVRPSAIDDYIFSTIDVAFHNYSYVYLAYCFSILAYFFLMGGIFLGSYLPKRGRSIFNIVARWKLLDCISARSAYYIYFFGVLIYLLFILQIGGLRNLWLDISQRTILSAGLGYYQAAYTFLIYFGSALLYVFLLKDRKWFLLIFMLLFSTFIMMSLGGRFPFALLCFILVIVHNYAIRAFPSFFNRKIFLLGLGLLIFMFSVVQLRPGQEADSFFSKFERDVIQRLGIIERQVSVIGYFDSHDYWGLRTYYSLISAPIPRGVYPDKPPVDTGVYINAIRKGEIINPPVPVSELEASSWPDGNLAGYMSFGLLGMCLVSFLSGLLYGSIYNFMKSNNGISSIVLYGMMSFMGVIPLSPFGIVQLAIIFSSFAVLSFFMSFRLPKIRICT